MLNSNHLKALENLLYEDKAANLIDNLETSQDLLVSCCVEDYGTLVGDLYYTLKLLKDFLREVEKLDKC